MEFASEKVVSTPELLKKVCPILSAFEDGATFQITGYEFVTDTIDGVKMNNERLTFTPSLNQNFNFATLFRKKVDSKGKILTPSGTFITALNAKLKPGLTYEEIIKIVLEPSKDTTIKVRREFYTKQISNGVVPASIIHLDFVE